MKIKRYNENIESVDFISIQEVSEIFAQLYDLLDDIKISNKWLSGDTEYHIMDNPEPEDRDTQVIMIEGQMSCADIISFYVDYGYDFHAASINDLSKATEVIKEIIDASKHIESDGYKVHTQITNYMFIITISKIGTLLL